jgi:MoaA/NifB/PqqE/SkfB family radical SAM enzyme
VSFILLAGGEPLTRPDVLAEAARFPDLLFPVFTNGTLLRSDLLPLFARHRHLIPLLSLEGGQVRTDRRRALGVYERVRETMDLLAAKSLLFGTSVTVTAENLDEVTSPEFFQGLHDRGCRAAVFVEFVPVSAETWPLVLQEPQRVVLRQRLSDLERQFPRALFVTFPGDEASSGGCLAAGRGFFHIGPDGSAEPCPFSPHSDISLRDHSLREALKSPLFHKVAEAGLLRVGHSGGCALVEQDAQVAAWALPELAP